MIYKTFVKKNLLLILLAASTGTTAFSQTQENAKSELLYQAEATTGEGSMWHPERRSLFWVDIEGCTLYEYLPETKNSNSWLFNGMVSTVVPESDSTVIVSLQNEIVRINVNSDVRETIAIVNDGCGQMRCNDGKCDPEGRFWVGTMAFKQTPGAATLYMLDKDGNAEPKIENVTISNGLVWSADKKYMYYIDTPTRQVKRYKYQPETGAITADGVAVDIPPGTGSPDGMCMDADGNLWIAHWGGKGVYCWNPITGKLIRKIDIPAPHVASCTFGGKNLDILFITTARAGLSAEQLKQFPLSGSVFFCKPGVKGTKVNYYKSKQAIAPK